jgi:hypothetical protein
MSHTDGLTDWIAHFIAGKDCSITNAQAIEVALDKLYGEDGLIQDTVTMLACYRAGGGEFLYDEEQMKRQLQKVAGIMVALNVSHTQTPTRL